MPRRLLLASLLVIASAHAAPREVPPTAMDFDFRQIKVSTLFRLLADVAKLNVYVPTCAGERYTNLKLRSAPLPIVFDVLSSKLHIGYRSTPGGIYIECLAAGTMEGVDQEKIWQRRVSVDLRQARASEVLQALAKAAGLFGSKFSGRDETISITLRNVQLSTAVSALIDSADLPPVRLEDNRLMVTPPSPFTSLPGGTKR